MSDQSPEDKHKARLKWACRRGMLELDTMLAPFVTLATGYDSLSPADQQGFERLLNCTDPDLYTWLMDRAPCPDDGLARVVTLIRQHNAAYGPAAA